MVALPANNTAVLFVDYRTQIGGVEHTLQLRPAGSGGAEFAAAQQVLLDVLTALGPNFFRQNWRILAARGRAAGSDVTAPIPLLPGLQAFTGSSNTAYGADREALEMRFVGRSLSTGTRVAMSLYGIAGGIPVAPFRITASTPTWGGPVVAAVDALNAGSANTLTIDGTAPLWYSYANLNYNSYWERRVRTGA